MPGVWGADCGLIGCETRPVTWGLLRVAWGQVSLGGGTRLQPRNVVRLTPSGQLFPVDEVGFRASEKYEEQWERHAGSTRVARSGAHDLEIEARHCRTAGA